MRKSAFIVFLAAAMGLMLGTASAESLQGEVVEVTPSEITLKVTSVEGKTPEVKDEIQKVIVGPETEFKGTILDELRVGDEIFAETEKNHDGSWSAQMIQIDKVNIR